jgi:protein-L-isoaspartate(D-aspartate) O-methyltransferase
MQTVNVREQMIEQQVRAWDVLDAQVLTVMREVPRELFASAEHGYLAYADVEVPLPCGQRMLRPSVAGRLLQALLPAATEPVLEIGTGTGFLTACLRAMAARVRSFEVFAQLADAARRNLAALGMRDVEVLDADAWSFESGARYGAIAVTGSLPLYDARFERMLSIGGRLFVAVGEAPVMEARLVRRIAEEAWVTESLFETVIDPLVNAARPPRFTF